MKRHLGTLTVLLLFGASILEIGQMSYAQDRYPASQQPMEIPAPTQQAQYPPQQGPYPQRGQYPPQQGYPQSQEPYPQQQGGPEQGDPQQQGQGDSAAARLSFIHGDVSTQHDGSSDWSAATINTPLVIGDQIATGKNSRGEVQLDHANILRLADNSSANITNLSRNQLQVQVGQGLVNFDVLKGSDADAEIQTPNVSIQPQRGEGSFRILVNSDGETIVDVENGSADISTPQGTTRVDKGQRITIQGDADNAQYQVSDAPGRDEWDRWNSDRDRTITSAESWRHTNQYYTGSQDLDNNGRWNDVPDYGSVWFPNVNSGWAPYRDGRWVYEPYYGWTWVSYESWGWAPYHYGRWFVYGGNWGWWPGPVYGGYRPTWAPAYVSFFGYGGDGWDLSVGFGSGNIGWLPCGPGDRFFPWYGRGDSRVNVVNVYNVRGHRGGFAPLREGPRSFSNVDRAFNDDRVRGGISSMRGDQFGRARVPVQQRRMDAGSFRQASLVTGGNPVAPSRESFHPSDRQVNPGSIPNRSNNQRFFGRNGRQATPMQGRSPQWNGPSQRSFGSPSQQGAPNQGSRSGWRTFSPSSRGSEARGPETNGGRRAYEGQGGNQNRPNSRPPQNYSRGGDNNNGNTRPPLNMQQPVVTPRTGSPDPPDRGVPGSYSNRGGNNGSDRPSYRGVPNQPDGYRGGPSGENRGGPPAGYGRGNSGGSPSGTGPSRGYPGGPSGEYRGGPQAGERRGNYGGSPSGPGPSGGYRGGPPAGGYSRGNSGGSPSGAGPSGGYRGGPSSGGRGGGNSRGNNGGGSRGGSSSGGGHSSSGHGNH
jgi:hypothetical protein